MYNRYIPQPDGSFRRNPVPEKAGSKPRPQPACPPPEPISEPPPRQERCCKERPTPPAATGIGNFLRQLLPKEFDTADLLIVLLLLLMAGDCPEEQNTALLTLALYLFL